MFIVKLAFFGQGGRDYPGEYFLYMLDIDEMGDYVCLLEEPDEGEGRHPLVLEFNFSVGKQDPAVFFHGEVVLVYVNHVQILELDFVVADCPDRALHEHLPVGLVHDHDP